ncbi:uncharacterized protein K452DRAFT_83323 [Aplosporella prunicola CBS 121167]|uniref:Uncharacterized protein n=1 Tax=Aplosporella prunicola CBS 121167 TaxID=1176127 RepID=A0A6A6B3A2_9PEZI|nr:uncharacterized protein K452DRAFT_83323 [Aplosporella prunicola CBS 121167]KAF2138702.1 hypothetical protein K452DRAFT_83323 [Aplosporella prunicola CBS 121167]
MVRRGWDVEEARTRVSTCRIGPNSPPVSNFHPSWSDPEVQDTAACSYPSKTGGNVSESPQMAVAMLSRQKSGAQEEQGTSAKAKIPLLKEGLIAPPSAIGCGVPTISGSAASGSAYSAPTWIVSVRMSGHADKMYRHEALRCVYLISSKEKHHS